MISLFYISLRQSQGPVLIAKISYDYCDITSSYSMSDLIAFVTVIYKHTTKYKQVQV